MIRQLKTKIKEQEHSINELSSAVERFLKIQPIVKKLQGNILKIPKEAVAQEKIKVTASNIDPGIVKPSTPSLEKSVGMTKRQRDNVKSGTDKNSQCHYRMNHPKTSEKKSCKRLACMATPVRRSRDTSIHSGSPADSQSAPEQSESDQEYNSTTKTGQDSSLDD